MVAAGGLLEPEDSSCLARRLTVTGDKLRKPDITKISGSSVLDRAAELLPKLASAEKELKNRIKDESKAAVDVEMISAGSAYIEMTVDCGVVELLNDEAVQSAELSMPKGASWVDLLEEEEEVACATPHTEGPCELLREGTKKRKLTLINAQETIDASIGELLPRKSKRLVREIN